MQHLRIEAAEELQRELGLAVPPRVIETFDISNISGTHAVASMVASVDGVTGTMTSTRSCGLAICAVLTLQQFGIERRLLPRCPPK